MVSITAVKSYFKELGLEDRVLEFSVSSATVALAAQAVGCEEARIAKTLSFLVDGHAVLIVTAGDAKIDNRKFKDQFHTKAKMLTAEELAALVGHAPGGVCPFAVPHTVEVWLDESLRRFPTVFPAAGSDNSAIELSCGELERFSCARGWADLCRGWRPEEQ
ncbi:proline--tRNA ligase [Eubacteriales bacterium]|nr:proline--tRNA ligase [Eubacteriales bacterium]GKH62081.1 proline--tRNA ligase [Eubacteriales bacterium]